MLDITVDGVEIRKALLSARDIEHVKNDICLDSDIFNKYGVRNLEKKFTSIRKIAFDEKILSVAKTILGDSPRLVRAIFFDKTPDKNWFVGWHQDKTVSLNKKVDLNGWSAWTVKDGVHHVQPPLAVLDRMITIRLHIDAANQQNGCLKVIPGSHRHGILKQEAIDDIVSEANVFACEVDASDAVLMRPHIIHSSSRAVNASHRRVVHLEYSCYNLPEGVSWA